MSKLKLLFFTLILLSPIILNAQEYKGSDASKIIDGAVLVRVTHGNEIPDYVKYASSYNIPSNDFENYLRRMFKVDADLHFSQAEPQKDKLGYELSRYTQSFNNFQIHNAKFNLLSKAKRVHSYAGTIHSTITTDNQIALSTTEALDFALAAYPAETYKWELPEEEAHFKRETGNTDASYYPIARPILLQSSYPKNNGHFKYCYAFTIYAHSPLKKAEVFIDAANGACLLVLDQLHQADIPATAITKYSGTQEIIVDSYSGGYRLRETGRGDGIETYNMGTSTNYGSAVDFVDSDNFWNNFNASLDEVATDAHWGAEMTYDYFYFKHNRNSIDNQGFALRSYVHYDNNYNNAFWDGNRMTYGDGNGSTSLPLTALDICGHEISHGLTSFTANLDYSYESGALNEGFSDIFGTAIEFYAKPNDANWTIGEDIGSAFRSMSNPNIYNQPDTYHGNSWYFGSDDNGGVHTNSGVINFWYYLLVTGGSGTNDNGDAYNVSAIGQESADKIAFRTLVSYLNNTSQYADARFYSILSAVDLYGGCSAEVESVTKAWYAVGVGPNYVDTVVSDFSAAITSFCQPPATVHFNNQSINGMTFQWNFGDGSTSSIMNPTHEFSSYGTFDIILNVDGGTCGSASKTDTAYINIDATNPCIEFMGNSSIQTACTGILYDNGGPTNYSDNTDETITIAPNGALNVSLYFTSFNFENTYDFLYVYDGPSTSSPLIGQFTGSNLPNGGTINSSAGSITIRQTSDVYVTQAGFELNWSCNFANAAPACDFSADVLETCDGEIFFQDLSSNGPTSWLWEFGDGTTSTDPSPSHVYQTDGTYTVTLNVANSYGSDSLTVSNMVLYTPPINPIPENAVACNEANFNLTAQSDNLLLWYSDSIGGELIHVGDTLSTPFINTSTIYWAESLAIPELRKAAKEDNTGGGNLFSAAVSHHLVFDIYKQLKLVSVKVYAGSAGNRKISLNDANGNEIDYRIVYIPSGESRILLDFEIAPGNNYQLAGPESPDLFRNNGGNAYPYLLPGFLSVKNSSASTDPTGYYYYFYDWEVIESTCLSNRVPVLAEIITEPLANFSYQASLNELQFTNLSNNALNSYWDFGDGSTSIDEHPVHTYTQSGTYTVQLITVNDCGSDSISIEIEVSLLNANDKQFINTLNVFPNPADQSIRIKINAATSNQLSIKLIDVIGHTTNLDHLTNFSGVYNKEFNTSNLLPGIYILNLTFDDKQKNVKLVISR